MCTRDTDRRTVLTSGGLTPVQESLFLTLYLRALDARSADPILGDTASAELADVVGYDFSRLRVQRSLVLDLATRTKALDGIVRRFTARCCARSPACAPTAPASRGRATVSSTTGSDAHTAVPS